MFQCNTGLASILPFGSTESVSKHEQIVSFFSMDEHNLFNDLFNVRIREGHSPKENFLSECFAHVLRTQERICETWVSEICGHSRNLAKLNVSTRFSQTDPLNSRVIFPDLRIDATTIEGEEIVILSEHKWDSPCSNAQLEAYRRIADSLDPRATLVFVGARRDQVEQARKSMQVDKSLYWEDIYSCLKSVAIESETLKDFLHFMKAQGLGPVPAITEAKIKAFVESKDLLSQLSVFCRKLADEYEWQSIPARYHGEPPLPVDDQYGRVAIEFVGANWAPAITLGFLYSNYDHRVPLIEPNNSIDLFLRLEASPKLNPNLEPLLKVFAQKLPKLREISGQALIKGNPENRNSRTLIIIQQSLTNILSGVTETHAQLQKIHDTLESWLSVLFHDGLLEPELVKLKAG